MSHFEQYINGYNKQLSSVKYPLGRVPNGIHALGVAAPSRNYSNLVAYGNQGGVQKIINPKPVTFFPKLFRILGTTGHKLPVTPGRECECSYYSR